MLRESVQNWQGASAHFGAPGPPMGYWSSRQNKGKLNQKINISYSSSLLYGVSQSQALAAVVFGQVLAGYSPTANSTGDKIADR
ncbi:MAG: hypothetical protein IPO25_23290 [Saprospiraceae bacterium]|nr:hypothetical protein [Saprospiraceae bacterium]